MGFRLGFLNLVMTVRFPFWDQKRAKMNFVPSPNLGEKQAKRQVK